MSTDIHPLKRLLSERIVIASKGRFDRAKKKEERVLLHQLLVWMCSQEAWSMSNEEFEREYKQRQEFIRLAISA